MTQASADPPATPDGSDRQMLLDFLSERDVPCPACGYNLRRLQGDNCPECGNHLKLTVGVIGGVSNAWITALVAALLPAGIGLPFHILFMIALSYGENVLDIANEPEGIVVLVLLIYALLCNPVWILLLSARRQFIALQRLRQKQISVALVILSALSAMTAMMLLASVMG